ncbi:MAG: C1 family peptidase [Phycisphaerales bacterium]|nr:C1 family peptidase [Phycisphaerales bacterium]
MTTISTNSDATSAGTLGDDQIAGLRKGFDANPKWKLAQNAVSQTAVDDVAMDRSIVAGLDYTFSTLLDDWKVTNQRQSGRCWMFAALNLLRVGAMKKMNLKEFEFSQNYTLFWDKFERANYFYEAVIETSDRPIDDRALCFLLDRPLDDGGQWNMFMNIVRKHGLVPKSAMPETQSSSCTRRMNSIMHGLLRRGARDLRAASDRGDSTEAIRVVKDGLLEEVWRVLCIHLGTPPTDFDWQWNDKDKEFHRAGRMTPQQFADTYVDLPLDDFVCIVHDARETSPTGQTYTVEHLGNVVGGEPVLYLNVEIDVMKSIAMKVLEGGEPVWFGCDVGKMFRRDIGIWDAELYDLENLYDVPFTLDKGGRLDFHETLMTHAMLFTGVDVVDGTPRRWRVENSWGDEKVGRKGFQVMNDSWFNEHMFEIAARKSDLPVELQQALETEPIVLPPWDPMGSLAG